MTPEGRLTNKVALVTGAASGIGRATSVLLARQAATVVLTDIAADAGRQLAEEIARQHGARTAFLPLDVGDEAGWQAVMDRLMCDFGKLDIAVNNAGIAFSRPVTEMTLAEWRHVLQVNLDGVFLGTKHAIKAMQGHSRTSDSSLPHPFPSEEPHT
jgi:NAD(P)-dependent dehydrogenase (short-subunit alcohol dehydrogenase family)